MSALGQKRTFAVQNGMSALRPTAASNTTDGMSAKGHKCTAHTLLRRSRCSSTCGQFFHGFGRQRLAANAPLTAVYLENLQPCHAAHVFAFDRNHSIGQPLNNVPFLFGVEHALDQTESVALPRLLCATPA